MTIQSNYPNSRPSLILDFANGQVLDNRITFLRSGTATYYDGKSSALAEQNLYLQSNNFTPSNWGVYISATLSQNATDPAGVTNNAWTITAAANTLYHGVYYANKPVIAAGTYVVSFYLQAGAGVGSTTYATVSPGNDAVNNYASVTFNLSGAGSVTQSLSSGAYAVVSSSITQVGSTAWYRCSVTFTTTGVYSFQGLVALSNSATFTPNTFGANSFTAAGTETLLIYGAQLEQRSTPTAYNQTTTTAISNYIPTLVSAPINTPRFTFNPVTNESLGLLLEGQSTNLATYSQDFTNAVWTKAASSITASANIAPDGTQTAQLLVPTAASSNHYIQQTVSIASGTTCSVYAKAGGYSHIALSGSANNYVYFDLSAGTVESTLGTGWSFAFITPVGNGWYRCVAVSSQTNTTLQIYAYNTSQSNGNTAPSFTGNGFSGVYLWGSQVEAVQNSGASNSLTSYIYTTSATVVRPADYTTITGTNFSGWFNNSQGTWYAEAQAGFYNNNVSEILNINNASGAFVQRLVAQLTTSTSSLVGAATLNPSSNATVNGVGVYNKIAYTYSNTALVVSELGVTPLSSSTNNALPTVTNMSIGYSSQNSVGWLNGCIKKLAYYPTAVSSANLQALTGS